MKLPFTRAGLLAALLLVAATAEAKPLKSHDITDTIYANPILTNFTRMLQASPDTYTFLSSRGPFTVFVPTDSAFAKLKPGELDALLRPENKDRLVAILYFHIINGKRLAVKDLMPLHAIFSCQGNPLTFKQTRSGVFLVQKAKVTHGDIHCANGNINEIDTVLMPPEIALPPMKFVPDAAPASTNGPVVTPIPVVPVIGDTNAIPVAPIAH